MSSLEKFLPATVWILLVLAIAIVWGTKLRTTRWEQCADSSQLAASPELSGRPSGGDHNIPDESGMLFDWRMGKIETPVGELGYQIHRSDKAINQALNWSLKLARTYQPTEVWTELRNVDGQEILIHWAAQPDDRGRGYTVGRIDYLGGEPVESVFKTQVLSGFGQLVYGRLPLTTYIVEGTHEPHQEPLVRRRAAEWLEAVVRRNREACAP